MLEDLTVLGRPFAHVGITGYPESHPTIHDDLTVQAMWDKRRYMTHIVSNLTFDPKAVRTWVARLRARGITPRIARRGVAHGSGLGRQRWVVARSFAWLHAFEVTPSPP